MAMTEFDFIITDDYDEIEFTDEQKELLPKQSGLNYVRLMINWYNPKYQVLDLTGTSNEEVIRIILHFYKHKTRRRLVGDHIFFEGFHRISDDCHELYLGS